MRLRDLVRKQSKRQDFIRNAEAAIEAAELAADMGTLEEAIEGILEEEEWLRLLYESAMLYKGAKKGQDFQSCQDDLRWCVERAELAEKNQEDEPILDP